MASPRPFVGALLTSVASATFVIKDDSFEGPSYKPVLLKTLANTATGESAAIIYSHGGRIEQVNVVNLGARTSLPFSACKTRVEPDARHLPCIAAPLHLETTDNRR